ncbi:MAG TPA: 50S ribosomal protein L23 [bacterium]|nr:50S ribosomal protein L23 [bacterium]HPL95880.1 50S ribosomal protein L23 [bacterium]
MGLFSKKSPANTPETETNKTTDKKVAPFEAPLKQKNHSYQLLSLLIKPIVTEKTAYLGANNQYVFAVTNQANKINIKKAIENAYQVKVVKVNIIKQLGKKVRYGKTTGRTKNWKKAIITLKPGEKIDLYEHS